MNIHAPERQPDETFAGYQERRRVSKVMLKEMTRGKRLTPNDPKTFFVTQHHATPARKARRDLVGMMGVRQYKKMRRIGK